LFTRLRIPLAVLVTLYTLVCIASLRQVTFDNDPIKLLRAQGEDLKYLDGEFAELERTTILVVEGEDLLTRPSIESLRDISERAESVEGVKAVFSMLDLRSRRRVGRYLLPVFPFADSPDDRFERARREALSHPFVCGHFLSDDLKTALVIVQFAPDVDGIARFQEVLSDLYATLDDRPDDGIRVRVTGAVALQAEIVETLRTDIRKLSLAGALLVVVLAVLLFRSIGAALLVASGPAVGAIWTVGTLALMGEPINMLTNVVPLLVLVIGFTDSMHLVLHMRRRMDEGASNVEAAESTVRNLGLPCALTSLSTSVGFGSLVVASILVIQKFGWTAAMGSVLSFFAVITVVPLLAGTPLGLHVQSGNPTFAKRGLGRLADWYLAPILRNARVILVGGVALFLLFAMVATRLEPDHTVSAEIPHSSSAYQALVHVDKTFGGAMFAYATVTWPEQQGLRSQGFYDTMNEVHSAVEANSLLANPMSILNLVESLGSEDDPLSKRAAELRYIPKELRDRQVNDEEHRAVISMHMPDAGARQLRPAFDDLQRQFDEIASRHPGFKIELVGGAVAVFRNIHRMIEDLWRSLATAAVIMFLMIWLGLRSLRYALVSIMPNIFPLLCTGAFIVLSGRYLEMSSVIVFSISLGIAVDDTIHFLVCYQRERRAGADSESAIRTTIQRVGKALVMTTVALVAGHTVVLFSGFPAIQKFGLLTALTIGSALAGDLLLLPALLVCVDKGEGKREL
jgi:uncharacterized protein